MRALSLLLGLLCRIVGTKPHKHRVRHSAGFEELSVFPIVAPPDGSSVDFVLFAKDSYHPPHIHDDSAATVFVVMGEGMSLTGSEEAEYAPGTVLRYPKGVPHGFRTRSMTLLLSIQEAALYRPDGSFDFRYAHQST